MISPLFSSFSRRTGATAAGIFGVAAFSVALLCGANYVPTENFAPQGAMQSDLNAGGHSVTNAALICATNVITPTITATGANGGITLAPSGTGAVSFSDKNLSGLTAQGATLTASASQLSSGNQEPVFSVNVPGNNVLALQNTNTSSFSALTFRDPNNKERMALGKSNNTSDGYWHGWDYLECSADTFSDVTPDFVIAMDNGTDGNGQPFHIFGATHDIALGGTGQTDDGVNAVQVNGSLGLNGNEVQMAGGGGTALEIKLNLANDAVGVENTNTGGYDSLVIQDSTGGQRAILGYGNSGASGYENVPYLLYASATGLPFHIEAIGGATNMLLNFDGTTVFPSLTAGGPIEADSTGKLGVITVGSGLSYNSSTKTLALSQASAAANTIFGNSTGIPATGTYTPVASYTGTSSTTFAVGSDPRFPASVSGLRHSSGTGATDTAETISPSLTESSGTLAINLAHANTFTAAQAITTGTTASQLVLGDTGTSNVAFAVDASGNLTINPNGAHGNVTIAATPGVSTLSFGGNISGVLGVSNGGQTWYFDGAQELMSTSFSLMFSSGTSVFNTKVAGIDGVLANGTVEVNNGTIGNANGKLKAANFIATGGFQDTTSGHASAAAAFDSGGNIIPAVEGQVTLSSGTATVSNAAIATTSKVAWSVTGASYSGTTGAIIPVVASGSVTFHSTNGSDASVVNYAVVP